MQIEENGAYSKPVKIIEEDFHLSYPKIISLDEKNLDIVNVDPINKGPYILETLKLDKNSNKNDAI